MDTSFNTTVKGDSVINTNTLLASKRVVEKPVNHGWKYVKTAQYTQHQVKINGVECVTEIEESQDRKFAVLHSISDILGNLNQSSGGASAGSEARLERIKEQVFGKEIA